MNRIPKPSIALLVAALLTVNLCHAASAGADFRPPAVPLVTYNPFLSIWSESDHLNDATTKHWTRHPHSLVSLIRIDGKTYRLMGSNRSPFRPLYKKSVEVLPTRTIYEFEDAGVHVTMTFMQPRAAGRSRRLFLAVELHYLVRCGRATAARAQDRTL